MDLHAGPAPAAGDASSANAAWNAAADADAVPTSAWGAACSVPWGTPTTVHEGSPADGAASDQARDAGSSTPWNEAWDASAAVRTAEARDAAPATWPAAAWTEPAAVASYL